MTGPDDDTPAELIARLHSELPAALPTATTVSGPHPTAGNDLYEAYLFALLLAAARDEGYQVEIQNHRGRTPAVFMLRRSPGRLASPGPFCHAVLTPPDRPILEAHTGVAVIGRSKVAHEADLLLLKAAEAARCRAIGADPSSRGAILVVEAKYYSNPVGLKVGREFLGLTRDLGARDKVFAASIPSPSLVNLLAGSGVLHEVGVLPRRKAERDLLGLFGRVLRDYRGRR